MTCRFRQLLPVRPLFCCLALIAVTLADGSAAWVDDLSPIAPGDWTYDREAHLIERAAGMMFTEFGRRVEENGSLGTDHGTATPMFIVGRKVKGASMAVRRA
jgi:hypothetical protein